MTNFMDAVREKRQANEPATVGHHAAAAAHLVNMSVRQGRRMEWDFKADTVKTT
jgi:hypothetical protein